MLDNLKKSSIIMTLLGLSGVLNFLVTLQIINELGPASYGKYSWLLAISGIQAIFIDTALKGIIPVIGNKVNQEELFNHIASFRIIVFTISTAVITIIYNDLNLILALLCFGIPYFEMSSFYELNSKNIIYSWINLVTKLSYSITVIIIISYSNLNVENILVSYGIIHLISLIYQHKNLRLNFKKEYLFQFNNYSKNLLIGMILPVIYLELSQFTMGGISKLILEKKLGIEALGIFATALQFLIPVNLYIITLEKVFRVDFIKKINVSNDKLKEILTSTWLLLLVTPITAVGIIIAVWGNQLIPMILSPEYTESFQHLHLISVIMVLVTLFSYLKNIIIILEKTYILNRIMILTSIVIIIGFLKAKNISDFFLIIAFGYIVQIFSGFVILINRVK